MTWLMCTLTMVAAMLGLAALYAIWGGYVLTCLWGWFVVPTFALPPLTLAQAIGVSLIVGYLTNAEVTGGPLAARPVDCRVRGEKSALAGRQEKGQE